MITVLLFCGNLIVPSINDLAKEVKFVGFQSEVKGRPIVGVASRWNAEFKFRNAYRFTAMGRQIPINSCLLTNQFFPTDRISIVGRLLRVQRRKESKSVFLNVLDSSGMIRLHGVDYRFKRKAGLTWEIEGISPQEMLLIDDEPVMVFTDPKRAHSVGYWKNINKSQTIRIETQWEDVLESSKLIRIDVNRLDKISLPPMLEKSVSASATWCILPSKPLEVESLFAR